MRLVKQFSVPMINKPGSLANICHALAEAKVNVLALNIFEATEQGLLRIVVDKPEIARLLLSRLNSSVTETDVLAVELPNRPGVMAGLAERLGREHININYAYATTAGQGNQTIVIVKVQYPEKAMKTLKDLAHNHKAKSGNPVRQNFRRF
jgi:hypothetical protein